MNNKPTNNIRIHPMGTRVTDNARVQELATLAPVSFRVAQDVLVAAQKYVNKSGFFSSEQSRIQKLQAECHELLQALRFDQFMTEEMDQQGELFVFMEFFSLFSDAFPNWQKEYDALNRLVPHIFRSLDGIPSKVDSMAFCENLIRNATVDAVLDNGNYMAFLIHVDADSSLLEEHFKCSDAVTTMISAVEARIANRQYNDPTDGIDMLDGIVRRKPNTNVMRAVVGRDGKPLFRWNPPKNVSCGES
ncbi:MAG: hypothetical protein JSS37_03590 [Proteobacteria bacterium]|nr:hypothetical protein [Pseudomonadota bacterium]